MFAFLTVSGTTSLQAQGFRFVNGSYEEALAQAKKESKMLLVVTTASFSEASFVMVDEVMSGEAIGKYYNQHFLGWVLDADPLEPNFVFQGIQLRNMPEYLFMDDTGEVQYRESDYLGPEEVMAMGKRALNPANHASTLQAAYQEGNRDPEFMQRYILTMHDNGKEVEDIALKYLAGLKQEDLLEVPNWMITTAIVDDATSATCKYVVDHYSQFCAKFEKEAVDRFLLDVYNLTFSRAVRTGEVQILRSAHYLLDELYADQGGAKISGTVEMNFFVATEDWPNYQIAALKNLYSGSGHDADYYNNAATHFYYHIDDPEALEKALEWSALSIEMSEEPWSVDTRAALLFKLGRKEEALKAAREAVELSGDDKENVEFSLELLKNEK